MFTNNKKNEITISIKRFYSKNVSSQKTVEVNKETFDFLCSDKVHKESMARKDRRHILAFPWTKNRRSFTKICHRKPLTLHIVFR